MSSRTASAQAATETTDRRTGAPRVVAILLMIAGCVGFYGSFKLVVEKYDLLEHPNQALGCDINPFVSCSTVIDSWQSHIFGFPNPILGVAGFAAPIGVAIGVLAGMKVARWYWVAFNIGLGLAWVFVTFLFTQTVFFIGALCPWCMLVWSVTIPMFWVFTVWNIAHGNITRNEGARRAMKSFLPFSWTIPVANALVIVVIILTHFPLLLRTLF
ncbi:vitamin K epoxide reductase family protein [Frondihabitans australicus]|uniref:Putative membrane protein n=1 Tax=Frondihabitans australicus TaxID=386892 RepID=A0A495IGP3_9MICO|nr:vitamin K epoxide reductase family protein [Frondihabitans australicus]RKR74598.1 putative membrane protein [Frondihabitans australicus]